MKARVYFRSFVSKSGDREFSVRQRSDCSGVQDRVQKSERPDHRDAPAIANQRPEMNRASIVRRAVLAPLIGNERGAPAKRHLVV